MEKKKEIRLEILNRVLADGYTIRNNGGYIEAYCIGIWRVVPMDEIQLPVVAESTERYIATDAQKARMRRLTALVSDVLVSNKAMPSPCDKCLYGYACDDACPYCMPHRNTY